MVKDLKASHTKVLTLEIWHTKSVAEAQLVKLVKWHESKIMLHTGSMGKEMFTNGLK